MKFIFAAALAAALSACATHGTEIAGATIDRSYATERLTWRSGQGGFIISLKAHEDGGKVALCGAFAEIPTVRYGELTVQVANRAFATLAGVTISRSLERFKRHQPTESLTGLSATCVRTDVDWRAEFEGRRPAVVFGKGTYVIDS